MSFEVEQKFPVADLSVIEKRLTTLGVPIAEPLEEVDLYFAHPSRNFVQTDEALRIRRTKKGNSITYKGPKIDTTTKTRKELDLPLPEGTDMFDAFCTLLESLGFTRVAEVCKLRRKAIIPWHGDRIEASLDRVVDVGTFVELELITDFDGIESAKQTLASIAEELGLSESERSSYLELLLANKDDR